MADITMCEGGECKLKHQCYRFKANPNPWRQSYFTVPPVKENGECDDFWEVTHGRT